MNNQFLIFISLLIIFNILIFTIIENYPYGSYARSNTLGRLIPKQTDRDTNPKFHIQTEEEEEKDDENNVNNVQLIDTGDTYSGNYSWDSKYNFPYGGYIYDKAYPVYPAPNICPPELPFYSTLEGKCIAINTPIAPETPSTDIIT